MTDKPTHAELLQRIKELKQEIFEHTLIEEALSKSEEKYKLLAEHSADIIYKLNIETNQYTYISPSIERMLGYTVAEGLSLKAEDTVTAESYEKQADKLLEAIANQMFISKNIQKWMLVIVFVRNVPKNITLASIRRIFNRHRTTRCCPIPKFRQKFCCSWR